MDKLKWLERKGPSIYCGATTGDSIGIELDCWIQNYFYSKYFFGLAGPLGPQSGEIKDDKHSQTRIKLSPVAEVF